ncbi:hypothetical protein RRG43_00555 [Mycoplasmopsis cynos]|uniref:hypothetical protein n=1 Tax=Mycoplasmopsis cynos TaxID=171284 RepID=UPI002AFEC3D9|nr:hypothetical protein [Mycoplasmopsis cynos]WQQ15573.1 hypothetical protein RRG43_00555 [Mycoplasmopsis cynos]
MEQTLSKFFLLRFWTKNQHNYVVLCNKDTNLNTKFIDECFHSLIEIKNYLQDYNGKKMIFISGRKFIYQKLLKYANIVYLTIVNEKQLIKTDDLDGYIYLNVDEFLNKYNHRDLIFKNRNIKIYKYYDKRSNYVAK